LQNGILTPLQLLIIILLLAERPADALTPAKQLVTAFRGVLNLNPAEPVGKKTIFKTSKKTGRWVLKKVLIKWSEGLIIITITAITVATIATPYITATNRNHVALYIIKKDTAYRNILKRSKKSLKLNLKLLIEISLVNLITNLRNNLINIL